MIFGRRTERYCNRSCDHYEDAFILGFTPLLGISVGYGGGQTHGAFPDWKIQDKFGDRQKPCVLQISKVQNVLFDGSFKYVRIVISKIYACTCSCNFARQCSHTVCPVQYLDCVFNLQILVELA